ncbi:MAG: (2Fe-2S)-binding protein [Deltaproteobacteria bacterium]|nr:(2Fe-2S)-binding protein [Deltaproteobacteria bacterium]
MKVALKVNGVQRHVDMAPLARLLDALRGPLGLTGTKEGCGEGECGSCAVFLDGVPVNACLVPIGQCDGCEVVTVEGLAAAGHLAPLQACMAEHGGAQCGICTPGMLIAAEALLRRNPDPTPVEVRTAIAGNLCRCTGYERIVQSVLHAAHELRSTEKGAAE